MTSHDRSTYGYDVADTVLGRDADGAVAVEAVRPASDVWRLTVDPDIAASALGIVARHHFDLSDRTSDVWQVTNDLAPRLTEVLSKGDAEGLLALIAAAVNATTKGVAR